MESLRTLAFGCTFPPRHLIPAVFKTKNLLIARFSFEVSGKSEKSSVAVFSGDSVPALGSVRVSRLAWMESGTDLFVMT